MRNNKIKTLVISALMVVSALGPQRSHAVVGIVTGNPFLIVFGGILSGIGVVSTTLAGCLGQPGGAIMFGTCFGIPGLIMLPTDSNSVVLPELNEINSLSLDLTEAELQAYQSEKMDLDVLFQDLNDIAHSAESPEMGTQRVAAEFEKQKSRFSPHTLNALKKILQPNKIPLVSNT